MKHREMTGRILKERTSMLDRMDAVENAVNANAKAAEHNQRGLAAAYQVLNGRILAVETFLRLPWWKRAFRSLPTPPTIEPKKETKHEH